MTKLYAEVDTLAIVAGLHAGADARDSSAGPMLELQVEATVAPAAKAEAAHEAPGAFLRCLTHAMTWLWVTTRGCSIDRGSSRCIRILCIKWVS